MGSEAQKVIDFWEFPKIGDPNIAPCIVGILIEKDPQNKVPRISGNSHIEFRT